jgi:outer membrane protein assembly factor BamB
MKNSTVVIGVAALVVAGTLGWSLIGLGGCRSRETRIAEKTLFTGVAPTTTPAAEDWPRWRGPRGDGVSRETGLLEKWPDAGPTRLWSADVGVGFASPVAAAGRVYCFSLHNGKESLTAFDAFSGKILWNVEQSGGWTGSYEGTRATPNIDGDRVYTLGGRGDLTCRDLADGRQRWTINILNQTGASPLQWGTASSPLIVDNLIYVQVGDGGPTAVAVDKNAGSIAWKSQATGKSGYAAPILADVAGTPQLVVLGGTAVYGMDPATGRTLWQEAWPTSYDVNAATPVYHQGHLFVSSEYNHGAMMLELSPGGAKKLWENREIQCKIQPPVLDVNEDVLYANSSGTLKCMGWPDGQVKWSASDTKLRLGAGGSIVRWQDYLISMSERGVLSLVRATPAGAQIVSQTKAFDESQVWATPLIYGGRLYAKGEAELVCFDLAAAPGATTQPVANASRE